MLIKEELNNVEKKIVEYGMLNYHVLESMADWVRVVDKEGTIIYANKTMKEELGSEIIGMKCHKAIRKDMACSFCITDRSIETGEIVQKEEKILGRYFSVKSSPVANSNGKIFAAVEVFRDVTRERRLELELIDRNKKMSKDLLFAKKIQEKILPNRGALDNVSIDYIYRPSEMLSGDIFDFFHLDDNNIGIYIADVSGHGVAAAIMTMFIRQTMRAIKDSGLSPSNALTELHSKFESLGLEVDKYITIFCGLFNKSTYEFKYSNAGHHCVPIKYNEDSVEMLEAKGFPIFSLFNKIEYEENVIQLKKGDKILLYTDGIIEAKDKNGIEFGIESIINIVNNRTDNILKEIEDKIISNSWGELEDDIAIVLMDMIK